MLSCIHRAKACDPELAEYLAGVHRHGAIEKDRYIAESASLLDALKIVKQCLYTTNRERWNHHSATAFRRIPDDILYCALRIDLGCNRTP